MERKPKNGWIGIVLVAILAYWLGKESANDPAPYTPAPFVSSYEAQAPTEPIEAVTLVEEKPPEPEPPPVYIPAPRYDPPAYYANCSAARAAGAAPVYAGEAGYARRLDRDNDGVGCE